MQEGYREALAPLVKKGDVKIVLDQFTPKWKTEPAQAHAENALTRNGNKVNAFLVSYDGMSLGVLQACERGPEPATIPSRGRTWSCRPRRPSSREDVRHAVARARRDGRGCQGGRAWRAASPRRWKRDHNGQGRCWAKTPITLVTAKDMPAFVCAPRTGSRPTTCTRTHAQEADLQVSAAPLLTATGSPSAFGVGARRADLEVGEGEVVALLGRTARASRRSCRSSRACTRTGRTRHDHMRGRPFRGAPSPARAGWRWSRRRSTSSPSCRWPRTCSWG